MNKLLIILTFCFSFSLFSYTHISSGDGMCGEYANFQVNKSSFPSYWQDRIVEIAQNSANWWNEAGSEHHLYYAGVGSSNPDISWGEVLGGSAVTHTTTVVTVGSGICIKTGASYIVIDKGSWNYGSSLMLQNTLAHEFGHLIGLNHTDDVGKYHAILMVWKKKY